MNVSIIGTGYVGLTTGACLAYLGHHVTCVDTDQSKIERLEGGEIPIYEPCLKELVQDARPNIKFTTAYEEAIPQSEVVFIAVGTPTGQNGAPDLRYLQAAAYNVGDCLRGEFTVVVNKSTVPIGSGNWVGSLISERAKAAFSVASNPEFLREGAAISDTLYPDRIVVGSDCKKTAALLYTLYRPIIEQSFSAPRYLPRPEGMGAVPLISADLASAELVKYAANAFLALKISYINEIGCLANRVGADIEQVAKGIGLDRRIGNRFLQAGIGWGGSCFGKDTAALVATAKEYGLEMPIVEAAREVNQAQRERAVNTLLRELKILKGRTIGLLGLAFKPDTDDLRDAPALDVARKLLERGARVRVHDPIAMERSRRENPSLALCYCETAEEVACGADAVMLMTEWLEYRDLKWEVMAEYMKSPVVLDGRHMLNRARMEKAGLNLISLSS